MKRSLEKKKVMRMRMSKKVVKLWWLHTKLTLMKVVVVVMRLLSRSSEKAEPEHSKLREKHRRR